MSIWVGCLYKAPLQDFFKKFNNPCEKQINYSIGNLDNRFGMNQEEFLNTIKAAAKVWNEALNKNIFIYQEDGDLKINLIYDTRQDATSTLQKLSFTIEQDRESYDALKKEYDALISYYNENRTSIVNRTTIYKNKKRTYDNQVDYWVKKGGAPEKEYNQLEEQRIQLSNESQSINQATTELNKTVDSINAIAAALNKMAASLNINAKLYNGIGETQGDEFQEGVYRDNGINKEIDIYQFDNRTKLIRVLIHEMGHALGIKHVEDQNSIMYKINSGTNLELTTFDIDALKKACNINP